MFRNLSIMLAAALLGACSIEIPSTARGISSSDAPPQEFKKHRIRRVYRRTEISNTLSVFARCKELHETKYPAMNWEWSERGVVGGCALNVAEPVSADDPHGPWEHRCYIVIAHGMGPAVLAHEEAHCKGWSAHHPYHYVPHDPDLPHWHPYRHPS